jgi:hypothetical protein
MKWLSGGLTGKRWQNWRRREKPAMGWTVNFPGTLIWGHDMSDSDGIQISDKPSWQHTAKELFAILGKRMVALPSKMLGFKPFCLYLATWLLIKGLIRDWIWFAVMVMVLFGIVGLKVISRWKQNE